MQELKRLKVENCEEIRGRALEQRAVKLEGALRRMGVDPNTILYDVSVSQDESAEIGRGSGVSV